MVVWQKLTKIIMNPARGQVYRTIQYFPLTKHPAMIGSLSPDEVEEMLRRQLIGRIGCHAHGITYIVPVSYAYDGQYLYVRTHEGMKVSIMRKNPRICFETDSIDNMANWKSVIAWGIFEELRNNEDRECALNCLLKRKLPLVSSETTHLSPYWPFPPKNLNDIEGVVFRIRLEEKSGRFEKH